MAVVFFMYTLISGTTETTIIQKGFWYSIGFTLVAIKISTDTAAGKEKIKEDDKVPPSYELLNIN